MGRRDERIVTVGMTGASGAQYGLRLVECLLPIVGGLGKRRDRYQ
mgnify:CR=1 FL=1